ncbi:hypothetical protein EDC96DRAFT_608739 [Choanephora cucurbitarum]|nr:hypothetical protein EDC96DRAFT_608739 [Choanephora cucurbitarum]
MKCRNERESEETEGEGENDEVAVSQSQKRKSKQVSDETSRSHKKEHLGTSDSDQKQMYSDSSDPFLIQQVLIQHHQLHWHECGTNKGWKQTEVMVAFRTPSSIFEATVGGTEHERTHVNGLLPNTSVFDRQIPYYIGYPNDRTEFEDKELCHSIPIAVYIWDQVGEEDPVRETKTVLERSVLAFDVLEFCQSEWYAQLPDGPSD